MSMSGFLNINKISGPTSHDIVAKVRKSFEQKVKVGHLGTLDPMAEGVLPIAIGSATRTFPFFLELQKTYEVTMIFGKVTETQDITGKLIEENLVSGLELSECQNFLDNFLGKILQTPPMFSAINFRGKRLYELARDGIEIDRKKRKIEIFNIKAKSISGPYLDFEVKCSRGTYVRTLCHDLGKLQGSGGCMVSLRRTGLGPFCIQKTLSLDDFAALSKSGSISEVLVTLCDALGHLPLMTFTDSEEDRLRKGIALHCLLENINISEDDDFRMLNSSGKLIGIGRVLKGISCSSEKVKIRPIKIFN